MVRNVKEKQTCRSGRAMLLEGEMLRGLAREVREQLGVQKTSRYEDLVLLKRVIELGIAAWKSENATESFEQAAWASVEARQNRRAATVRDLRHYVRRMLKVDGVAQRPLRAMSTKECRALLKQAFGGSVHSYRKGRAILHSIFAYGIRQEWCDVNPVSRIEVPRADERLIEPLNVVQVRRLLAVAQSSKHRAMRFSLHLMLYCGLRPNEVRRLVPARDLLWEDKQLIVRPMVSKTGGGRMVPLRRGSVLRRGDCVIPRNWEQRWRSLRRDAGFASWVPAYFCELSCGFLPESAGTAVGNGA